jgi:hypothetical protein
VREPIRGDARGPSAPTNHDLPRGGAVRIEYFFPLTEAEPEGEQGQGQGRGGGG